ncbi:MAG: DUF4411 family protein [Nannocystaceae bacterium]
MNLFKPTYCIDTCSILERRRHYPPDVFAIWERIDELIDRKRLFSSIEVYNELKKGRLGDDAMTWAKDRKSMFLDIDNDVQDNAIPIIQKYGTRLINHRTQKSAGDPWVIALAKSKRAIVITEELPSRHPQNVKIPDVCRDLKIEYVNLLGLIRREGWTFS